MWDDTEKNEKKNTKKLEFQSRKIQKQKSNQNFDRMLSFVAVDHLHRQRNKTKKKDRLTKAFIQSACMGEKECVADITVKTKNSNRRSWKRKGDLALNSKRANEFSFWLFNIRCRTKSCERKKKYCRHFFGRRLRFDVDSDESANRKKKRKRISDN